MDDELVKMIAEARRQSLEAGSRPGCSSARGRVAALVDPGSFAEFGQLAGGEGRPAAGLVGGVGTIDGLPAVVAAYDAEVDGGAQTSLNQMKIERLVSLAQARRWPFVCWVEGGSGIPSCTSAGARPAGDGPADRRGWQEPQSGPNPGIGGGQSPFGLYDGLCELSGWVPTIAVLSGTALGGNAAIAAFVDTVVAVRGARIGLDEELVRNLDAHEGRGDIDLVVEDEEAAARAVRRYLSYQRDFPAGDPPPGALEIGAIVPDSRRAPYDMRKVLAAFADAGSILELRPRWATSVVTSFGRLGGRAVGIFANQPLSPIAGAIDADAADKISRFVELCDAHGMPLISFIDNPGYMVGPAAERAGIARHHTRPLSALHHRSVPLYSVQVRKAYGLGPYAMSGWGSSRMVPDLRLAWPSVESGGMSLEGAAFLVRRKEIQAAQSREEVRAIQIAFAEQMRDARSGLNAGRSFAFDDIVAPEETRDSVIRLLSLTPRVQRAAKTHYVDPM